MHGCFSRGQLVKKRWVGEDAQRIEAARDGWMGIAFQRVGNVLNDGHLMVQPRLEGDETWPDPPSLPL